MNFTETVKKYSEWGLSCLPTDLKGKRPIGANSSDWTNHDFELNDFNDCDSIGIKCGKASGNLECIDIDNHFEDAKEILTKYLEITEVNEIYKKYKLPIETTQRGGYHLLYRCEKIEGNRKLAARWKSEENRPDHFFETRGEGGMFLCCPSPGYKIIRNIFENIATISIIERAILIDNAVAMNEYVEPGKNEYQNGTDRPGDIYNSTSGSISEMKGLLQSAGWKDLGNLKWRRPGKNDGISATLGKVAPNVFYVFTGNGYPFDPMKAYLPFQVLALLKFGGDFSEAAKSIAPERIFTNHAIKMNQTEIEKILEGSKIDTRRQIEKPPTILSIRENIATSLIYKRVFTLGNFSCIIGKAKSRKTFFLSLITASLLNKNQNDKFDSDMPEHKNEILYFDTEQGEYDSYNAIRRIEKMAGTGLRLRGYNLRQFSPMERCQIIEYAFGKYGDKAGYCVIDGIADLANGINDEDEATRVTTFLLMLTKKYNCHISTIIHQNKNDNFATGHLGSAIMKKAEIIISVTKREGSASEINCDMGRGVDFEPFEMTINNEGMPEVGGVIKCKAIPSHYEETVKEESYFDNKTENIPF